MSPVSILAIRPHPDDECTGTGAILAYYGKRGERTAVLTCTLGEEGEIHDPDLDPEEARPRLAEIRERELRDACAVLGVDEVRLLRYRDSGMQGTESNKRPDAFCNADLDEAGQRVAEVIRELRPRVVLTENKNGTYGHPDHVMCHRAAVRGVELAVASGCAVDRLYSIELVIEGAQRIANMLKAENLDPGWFSEEVSPDFEGLGIKAEDADAAVDVSEFAPIMRQALSCHRTQIPRDNFLMTWPDRIIKEVFRTAYFRQLYPAAARVGQVNDLLEALPAVSS